MKSVRKYMTVFFISLAIVGATRCTKSTHKTVYHCSSNDAVIRTVSAERGVYTFLNQENVYAIRVASGIDAESFYILCSLPQTTFNLNDSVMFSGDIRSSTLTPQTGGQNLYELEATSIQIINK